MPEPIKPLGALSSDWNGSANEKLASKLIVLERETAALRELVTRLTKVPNA